MRRSLTTLLISGWPRRIAFTALYAAATYAGRLTRPDGTSLALVWPAAAVAFLWLATSWRRSKVDVVFDVALIFGVSFAGNRLTGGTFGVAGMFAIANALQTIVTCFVFTRLKSDGWRLQRPTDLGALMLAAIAGAVLSALVGPIAVALPTDAPWLATTGQWILRNGASTFVISAVGLRLARPELRRGTWRGWHNVEIAAATVVFLIGYGLIFGNNDHLPLSFLVIPVAVWVGLRFDTTAAAVHVLVAAILVVGLTYAGRGPLVTVGTVGSVVAAQAFIVVIGLVTMLIALYRDERESLLRRDRLVSAQVAQARDLFAGVLASATQQSIIGTDTSGHITVFNVGAERMLGVSAEAMIGTDVLALHDPVELLERADELGQQPGFGVLTAGAEESAQTSQWTYRGLGGTAQVRLTVNAMRDDDASISGYILIAHDVTEQLAAQRALHLSEQRFRLAFDTAPTGMAMIAASGPAAGSFSRVNQSLVEFVDIAEEALLATDIFALLQEDEHTAFAAELGEVASGARTSTRAEHRFRGRSGETRWGLCAMTRVDVSSGEPYALIVVEDVTARKDVEAALQHQALHDPLTGLANRSLFGDRLEHALSACARSGDGVGLLFIDLDGFKLVNDSLGHAAGDALLVEMADRLSSIVRPGDTVARLGGDEFAVICPGIDRIADLSVVAKRVLRSASEPVLLEAGAQSVSASIGLCISDVDSTAETLLRAADSAMYAAKRAGKNRLSVFHPDENRPATRASRLMPQLTRAVSERQFVMHGQPVIDLSTGNIVAVETLIRWQHPDRGMLPPVEFLDVVENSPLMPAIGDFALRESSRLAAHWSERFGSLAPDVHVNVAGRQLAVEDFAGSVLAALRSYSLPATRLVLELTETQMPLTDDSVRRDLLRLREAGVRIAIDDLGTGYSSLTRLTELPVDMLKIDRQFIAGLGNDPTCDAVVRAILSIGQALGLSVVAEGVETPQQADRLAAYGCDTVQGYLYSSPRPPGELLRMLAGGRQPGRPMDSDPTLFLPRPLAARARIAPDTIGSS